MTLSSKAKEAIKTALAMTIAYGVALAMDWDRPYWAGFAVAFVSLGVVGQSVNRAALRMSGTVFAAVAALILIAWFAQDRWLFIVFLSLYLGFCAYMMAGPKHQYFWQVGAFVCAIIAFDAGPDPAKAFDTAVIRAQQTGLGILVYSLVALFVWPVNSRPAFDAATRDLAATQHRLFNAFLGLLGPNGDLAAAKQLSAQEAQQRARFGQLLDAAETDSSEVRESRPQWRRYQRLLTALMETMGRWRESFADVRAMDLPRLMPGLEAVGAELDGRLAQLESMLAGKPPEQRPVKIDLPLETSAIGALSHFDQAAITVMRDNMLDLERLTRELFEVVDTINGNVEVQLDPRAGRSTGSHVFVPDPDRLGYAIRYMVIMWIAFVALIYVDGLPGGAGFVGMAGAIGIALATAPQIPIPMLYAPVTIGISLASVLYVFVMPQLSTFAVLGLIIFAVTFFFCYVYSEPRQMLGRAFGLAMFVVIASISNEQTYSFISVATTALMFLLLFPILALTVHFPISWRPERVFIRLLHRYFRSYQYLVSLMGRDADRPLTRYERWRESFHLREVSTIPTKLAGWAPHIDPAVLAGTPADRLQDLVAGLQELTTRLPAMRDAAGQTYAEVLRQQLRDDVRAWRNGVADALERLSTDPAAGEGSVLRSRLDSFVQRLESRIRETLNGPAAVQLGEREAEQFYRLLGAYRGVSEALVAYTERTGSIDWARWREERF